MVRPLKMQLRNYGTIFTTLRISARFWIRSFSLKQSRSCFLGLVVDNSRGFQVFICFWKGIILIVRKHMNKIPVLLSLALLLLVPLPSLAGDYIIGEGDGLDIAVWGVKDLTFFVKVRPDGKITVPGLGDVPASGQTPVNLQSSLSVKLKELVKNPIVTVTVRDITNSKIYFFGGGVKAGVYDLSRRTTLLQLLCSISEVKSADLKKSYLLRDGKKIKEDFFKLFISGETEGDLLLEAGDSLFMP